MNVYEQNVTMATTLYLDLLKKTLTNTIFNAEPNINIEQTRFIYDFARHYIQGPALSMLPLVRFDNLQSCSFDVIQNRIPGDFIETGVWRGGATIFMRGILKALCVTDRKIWVADSFEGLPEPDGNKYPAEAKAHHGPVMNELLNHLTASIDEVKKNFESYSLLDDQVVFLKGWFSETLPFAPINNIAILRIDGDYYESTMDALVNLYDKVSVGGYIIIDDYGETSWTYCKEAVDEFRQLHGVNEQLSYVDRSCVYWNKLH